VIPETSELAAAQAQLREDAAGRMRAEGNEIVAIEFELTAALLRQLESSLRLREAIDQIAKHAGDRGLAV
jgi:hypothetical protein